MTAEVIHRIFSPSFEGVLSMRTRRFQPSFDSLCTRITPSDASPVAPVVDGDTSDVGSSDTSNPSNTPYGYLPNADPSSCTGVSWVSGNDASSSLTNPPLMTISFFD